MLQIRGNDSLLFWGATAVVVTVLIGMWQHRRKRDRIPTKWRHVGELSNLQMFPLKSGAEMILQDAVCTQYGLQTTGDNSLRDRFFIVYGEDNGEFKNARTFNNMVFIKLTPVGEGTVSISAPDMPTIKVKIPDSSEKNRYTECIIWNSVKVGAIDCGDEAAAWLSKYIMGAERGLRLGHYLPDAMPNRPVAEKFKGILKNYRDIDTGAYPDFTSFMLMAQSSIDDLQTRLPPHVKITYRQFRPNFVVKGSQAYEEDKWKWVKIGETVFKNVKACTRCVFTTLDPDTGIMEPQREPLRTLREYRVSDDPALVKIGDRSPVLGIHLGLHREGTVRVGDKIYVGEE